MKDSNNHILHFSIGPVQGFVAQARRTRDLWAGSFLLSWLAGQAMACVLENSGCIAFPDVGDINQPKDALLAAILKNPLIENPHPQIGSLPNRFKAFVPESFDPVIIKDHVIKKWSNLCDTVWKHFILDHGVENYGNETKKIWNLQTNNFWEIQWVMGKNDNTSNDGAWLDIRKNWRTHWPEVEGGDHCTIMSDYQELSGFTRAKNKNDQDIFWNKFRENIGLLDLRYDERLCSIALVKRLFPKLSKNQLENTIGWIPGGDKEKTGNWPSTVYMAAVPWLQKFNDLKKIDILRNYEQSIFEMVDRREIQSERATRINCLSELGELANLDGNFFLETALANPRSTPLMKPFPHTEEEKKIDNKNRDRIIKQLRKVCEEIGAPASPYYALLLMDGDRLGKLLREHDQKQISQSLSKFTSAVENIVENHDGFTIYAGGDDVLAIVPINTAIECAIALRKNYTNSFSSFSDHTNSITASTAIIFTHYHNPLRSVLVEAHSILDKVAKEKNGRDSLAMALLKPSGQAAEWCATWTYESEQNEKIEPPKLFQKLEHLISQNEFSTGFFYNIRQRYPMLVDEKTDQFIENMDIQPILVAEFMKSREKTNEKNQNGESKREQAESNIKLMLDACYHYTRKDEVYTLNERSFQIGGVMLARFLAMEGLRK